MAIDVQAIQKEVTSLFPNERDRLDCARQGLSIYDGTYTDPEEDYYNGDRRSSRRLPILAKLVDTLTSLTYKERPGRLVQGHDTATEWIEATYKAAQADVTLNSSDKYAHIGDVCAIQVHATGDLKTPIRYYLWPADSFVVWCDPDDPTKPEAIAVIDRFDMQTRIRLWTADNVYTYQTPKWDLGVTAGGRTPVLIGTEENPYGRLPFTFVSYRRPTIDFWPGGLGGTLATADLHLNWRLMMLADGIRYSKPIGLISNIDDTNEFPRNPRPGEFYKVQGMEQGRNENSTPLVDWIMPPMEWVDKEWLDLKNYWNWMLQTANVPPELLPFDKVLSAPSGAAIVANQLGLVLYAEGRRCMFTDFEADLAVVTLWVGGIAYRRGDLLAASQDCQLVLHWPPIDFSLPPEDPNTYNQDLFNRGLISEVQLVMRQFRLGREQAIEHIKQVEEDRQEIVAIRGPQEATQETRPSADPVDEDEVEDDGDAEGQVTQQN